MPLFFVATYEELEHLAAEYNMQGVLRTYSSLDPLDYCTYIWNDSYSGNSSQDSKPNSWNINEQTVNNMQYLCTYSVNDNI